MALRQVNVDQAIDFLNELVQLDCHFMTDLVRNKRTCNDALAFHPTVQVEASKDLDFAAGFLGIINGLFGTLEAGARAGWGPITAVFDDQGRLRHFERTKP
jgi:hypothetical protein